MDDVDCHGNTGWVVRRKWDERDGKGTAVHRGVRRGFGPSIREFLLPGGKRSGIPHRDTGKFWILKGKTNTGLRSSDAPAN